MTPVQITLIKQGHEIIQQELLPGQQVTIGRKGGGAMLEIDALDISRKHVLITYTENGLSIKDTNPERVQYGYYQLYK